MVNGMNGTEREREGEFDECLEQISKNHTIANGMHDAHWEEWDQYWCQEIEYNPNPKHTTAALSISLQRAFSAAVVAAIRWFFSSFRSRPAEWAISIAKLHSSWWDSAIDHCSALLHRTVPFHIFTIFHCERAGARAHDGCGRTWCTYSTITLLINRWAQPQLWRHLADELRRKILRWK